MANRERGEVSIRLQGVEYTMRPTYQALVEIEGATGRKIMPLTRAIAAGDYGIVDMTAVIAAGIKAAGGKAQTATIGNMLVASGMGNPAIVQSVIEFLGFALTGGAAAAAPSGEEPAA